MEKHDCPPTAEDAREALVILENDLDLARAYLRMQRAVYDAQLV